ncbi:MAG: hypothetical protein ACKOQ5_07040 [Solirubrobacterales bacterium]
MSYLKRSIGKAVAGTAIFVAFLAALVGPAGPASAASTLCTYDGKALEPTLEFWRAASKKEEALKAQPVSDDQFDALYRPYSDREDEDSAAFYKWADETRDRLDEEMQKAIGDAQMAQYQGKERITRDANRWLRQNSGRLGEARALKMAWAKYRRGMKRLNRQTKAKVKEARTVCPAAMRGVISTRRSAEKELQGHFDAITAVLEERWELGLQQGSQG